MYGRQVVLFAVALLKMRSPFLRIVSLLMEFRGTSWIQLSVVCTGTPMTYKRLSPPSVGVLCNAFVLPCSTSSAVFERKRPVVVSLFVERPVRVGVFLLICSERMHSTD